MRFALLAANVLVAFMFSLAIGQALAFHGISLSARDLAYYGTVVPAFGVIIANIMWLGKP